MLLGVPALGRREGGLRNVERGKRRWVKAELVDKFLFLSGLAKVWTIFLCRGWTFFDTAAYR